MAVLAAHERKSKRPSFFRVSRRASTHRDILPQAVVESPAGRRRKSASMIGSLLLATSTVYHRAAVPRLFSPPQSHGAHVLLDFVGFHDLEPPAESGAWMLKTLQTAIAAHGVREVHSKLVVLGERGESPPGFTAVTLLDESHCTARKCSPNRTTHVPPLLFDSCLGKSSHPSLLLAVLCYPPSLLGLQTATRIAAG